ncbi:hypothetical protein EFY79_19250 [Hanamia caeni]|jgi:hypothetical protein|uniref:Uncharacterized protein n=1 Tax=Hanamia caeni TaxID=2294116 RepID=A0A3M9N6K4_9BACT|nr:hypothetical protein EFY79_19250 [Hanamia caeni]
MQAPCQYSKSRNTINIDQGFHLLFHSKWINKLIFLAIVNGQAEKFFIINNFSICIIILPAMKLFMDTL